MTAFGQLVISGIFIGGIYALMSIGLTLIFGVLRVVNFAHGEFLMLGMYGAWGLSTIAGLNPYTAALIDNNNVKSATYFDLAAHYDLIRGGSRTAQIYGVVQNVFDKDPPVDPTQVSSTNPVIYDVIGRTFRAGVRFSF